jgi:branched-chain amino acid transport system substrate-binding protein
MPKKFTKTLSLAVAASVLVAAAPALADDVKLGFLGGFTGPIESLTPPIFDGATLAVKEVNDQGGILDGGKLELISADGACDATAAGNAADKLVNTDQVTAIVGGLCTGESIGGFNSAGKAGNVVFVSPASSAPALTTLDDNDLVFRTTPSDAFQGVKMADLLLARGIKDVAVTYVNNDYGKGLADVFVQTFTAGGGTVSANVAHEDGKADYRAELGQLSSGGSQNLVILAYASGSGKTILQQAIEGGEFTTFVGGDGMVADDLVTGLPPEAVNGKVIATRAGAYTGESAEVFKKLATEAGQDPAATYAPQAYDAGFLLALAIEKNGKAERAGVNAALREVANAPGEKILPGEWSKAVELIKAGTDIDYEGASGPIEFDEAGDVDGIIVELGVEDGKFVEKGPIQ